MYRFAVELLVRGAFLDQKKFTTYLRWLQEIRRVTQPDGFVEVIEEGAKFKYYIFFDTIDTHTDIIFPVLPRWFTEPLRANDPFSSARHSSDSFIFCITAAASNAS